MFNFEIKNQSYQIALNKTKSFLIEDDLENGVYYLKKAIDLSNELKVNSSIVELKEQFESENKKLKAVLKSITIDNINPFLKKTKIKKESFEDNKSSFFIKTPPKTTLQDVAGLEEVKKEIFLNVIAPMKNPDIYFQYKDTLGCRILLYGPPGCGKSFVAEAIAGELKCAYALVNAHDILDKYVGEAPKRIASLFEEASKYERALIFFDELDALFSSRESDDSKYTKDVLTTFLSCLSGFNSKDQNHSLILIGATNRPWSLDSALVRGKRFDTHIYIGLPDDSSRKFLVNKHYKKHPNLLKNSDVSIKYLVDLLKGYSCADIEAILEKTNSIALYKALSLKNNEKTENIPILKEDFKNVLSNYRNSVSNESLKNFEDFKNGIR